MLLDPFRPGLGFFASVRRIAPFHAVPGRARADGWTPLKQAEFIGLLAQTGSVAEAARELGMTRETAYRLRRRKWSESFVAAWDAALGRTPPESHAGAFRKVTPAELAWRVESGKWQVILREGRYCGVWRKEDDTALCALVRATGLTSRRGLGGAALRRRPDF